jgi:hypothetical protein
MKNKIRLAAFAVLMLTGGWSTAWASDSAYLEFLWAAPAKGALARAEAYGFTLEPDQDHRVCVAALTEWLDGDVLSVEIIDASGKLVNRQMHEDFVGSKRCYKAQLGTTGVPGEWTFNVYTNQVLAGRNTIQVARTLEEAPFYSRGSRPYVLGRPNYDTSIPAGDYNGRLVWIMHVDAAGSVSAVDVESAEGAGRRMTERAIAAGLLTRFPPDPGRSAQPVKIRQEYKLSD